MSSLRRTVLLHLESESASDSRSRRLQAFRASHLPTAATIAKAPTTTATTAAAQQ